MNLEAKLESFITKYRLAITGLVVTIGTMAAMTGGAAAMSYNNDYNYNNNSGYNNYSMSSYRSYNSNFSYSSDFSYNNNMRYMNYDHHRDNRYMQMEYASYNYDHSNCDR